MPAQETFRERLTAICKVMCISQRELARRAGITHAHVHGILHGKVEPGLAVCESLAKAVGQDLGEMLSERTTKISSKTG